MLLKTTMMLGEFLSVKLGDWLLRANRPRVGHEAWHADPLMDCYEPIKCSALVKLVSRIQVDIQVRPAAATIPPTQPTAIPPTITIRISSGDRNLIDDIPNVAATGDK